jgi:hypothetical protein
MISSSQAATQSHINLKLKQNVLKTFVFTLRELCYSLMMETEQFSKKLVFNIRLMHLVTRRFQHIQFPWNIQVLREPWMFDNQVIRWENSWNSKCFKDSRVIFQRESVCVCVYFCLAVRGEDIWAQFTIKYNAHFCCSSLRYSQCISSLCFMFRGFLTYLLGFLYCFSYVIKYLTIILVLLSISVQMTVCTSI